MEVSEILRRICSVIGIILALSYSYQVVYMLVPLFLKLRRHEEKKLCKYAVLIAARNEEKVLPYLLDSIIAQDYPRELIDTYVIADNCTDNTAKLAAEHGANVYERFDTTHIGKGYALNFLLKSIDKLCGIRHYDAYFIFDADNVLEKDYITEMDKAFSAGSRVVTSYRNSKNYGQSWVASGYALWFLREARYLNNPRSLLGNSGAVSGTGFMVSSEVFEKNDGWKHHLLTEDIEFSVDMVIRGEIIGYCHDAVFYDEQPVTFSQSWTQRLRWAKGFLQVYRNYGAKLFKGIFGKNSYSCFDMTMSIMPAFIFTVLNMIFNWGTLAYFLIRFGSVTPEIVFYSVNFLIIEYVLMFLLGLITLLTERKKILCKMPKAILHLFAFPIFMLSYIPISIVALFTKVGWKQITHSMSVSVEDMKKQSNKN